MSAAHSKWPLPPISSHGLLAAPQDVRNAVEVYARAAQALAVEQDRLESGEPVAWRVKTNLSSDLLLLYGDAKGIKGVSDDVRIIAKEPLYAAPPNIRRLMEMVNKARGRYDFGEIGEVDLDAIEKAWREGK
jgi:hypothetical protein